MPNKLWLLIVNRFGSREYSIHYENDIKIVKVDYTGLHLTGVILK